MTTLAIKPEASGLKVFSETHGIRLSNEQSGFVVEAENMKFNATRVISASDIAAIWLWGDGIEIEWGDGQEMDL